MKYRLDRNAFKAQTFEEEQRTKTFAEASYLERLRISFYLNSIAFNFDVNNPPKMDKTVFLMRKLSNNE